MGWLFPEQASATPGEELEEWLQAQCTGPILEEPEPARAVEPARPLNWRRLVMVALLLVAGMLLAALLAAATLERHHDFPSSSAALVDPPVLLPPVTPVRLEAAPVPEPALPRSATGAPARLQLSSLVHGVPLETSGFALTAPSRRWAVKVVPPHGRPTAPRYASLFVVELGDEKVARLARVGPGAWLPLTSREARVFLMQTDQPADSGSFGLALGVAAGQDFKAAELREDVLTDAMTQIESSRFVLDGLEVDQVYEVTQQLAAKGPTPPVIATVTVPSVHARELRGAGFKQAGAPLDQVLLQPGLPVRVSGASRLSFVVLTTESAAEMVSTIDVVPRGAAPPPKQGAPTLPR